MSFGSAIEWDGCTVPRCNLLLKRLTLNPRRCDSVPRQIPCRRVRDRREIPHHLRPAVAVVTSAGHVVAVTTSADQDERSMSTAVCVINLLHPGARRMLVGILVVAIWATACTSIGKRHRRTNLPHGNNVEYKYG